MTDLNLEDNFLFVANLIETKKVHFCKLERQKLKRKGKKIQEIFLTSHRLLHFLLFWRNFQFLNFHLPGKCFFFHSPDAFRHFPRVTSKLQKSSLLLFKLGYFFLLLFISVIYLFHNVSLVLSLESEVISFSKSNGNTKKTSKY